MMRSTRPWSQQLELVVSLVKRDLKARYKDSVLGFLWSLFRPAFLTFVLWVVFSKILHLPPPSQSVPYWLHMLVSVLAWHFFVGSLMDATHSVVANANLIKKVPLDAEVFPISAVAANLVHAALAMTLAIVLAVYVTGHLSWNLVLLFWAFATLALFALLVGLVTAGLQVYFRDVGSLLELVTMAWFYVTPILYPVRMVQERLAGEHRSWLFELYMLNPAAPPIVAVRDALLYSGAAGEIPRAQLLGALVTTTLLGLVLIVPAWLVFRRMSVHFADEL